ncbi:hypothetical protein HD554DRAFT_2035689 [Boletus coccyginus]|nr:hypothetical protein HD554DRAFT_2035689 [Boletus coccyginus]
MVQREPWFTNVQWCPPARTMMVINDWLKLSTGAVITLSHTPLALTLTKLRHTEMWDSTVILRSGTQGAGFDFSICMGDLTAVINALVGNHDTYAAMDERISWTATQLVRTTADLWFRHEIHLMPDRVGMTISRPCGSTKVVPEESVEFASTHYAIYTAKRLDGLRTISLDTAICELILAIEHSYVTETPPKPNRAQIIGQVLLGWDGTAAQSNPTNLWEDWAFVDSIDEPQLWMYEVDSANFDVPDAYTWMSAISEFPALDDQVKCGPSYIFKYNTREAYGRSIAWGATDPLNATWSTS